MAVITISREFGSDGDLISQMVAKSLNYLLVDKELMRQVLKQYGVIAFDKVYDADHSIWDRFDFEKGELVRMLNKSILAFAGQNHSIILGRGGFVVLHEYSDVLNICIKAPFEQRVSNIMKQKGTGDRESAENLVRQNDNVRKNFLQTFYYVKCDKLNWFDWVIDTDKIPYEMAAKWIIEAAEMLDAKEYFHQKTSDSIESDPVLVKTIQDITANLKNT